MLNDPLVFELSIAKGKPQSYRKKVDPKKRICPFCDVENLTDIYEQKEELLLIQCVVNQRTFRFTEILSGDLEKIATDLE